MPESPPHRDAGPTTPLLSARGLTLTLALTALALPAAQAQQSPPQTRPPVVYHDAAFPELPFASRWIEVHGSKLHYLEAGNPKGDPILLIHGQPTWSYLWRNVIPHLPQDRRIIAIDLIGFGRSDRPDHLEYRFSDHAEYLEGFIDSLGLTDLTLVLHDWGSALGFDYAARQPQRVNSIAYFEALIPPFTPSRLGDLSEDLQAFFTPLRTPGVSEELLINQNIFVEGVLFSPIGVQRALTEAEKNAYRAPFPRPADRAPLWRWPQELPFDGQPADVADAFRNYLGWMSRTNTPMLHLYATPGAINGPAAVEWSRNTIPNISTSFIGSGTHYLQEDQPEALGRAVSEWLRTLR